MYGSNGISRQSEERIKVVDWMNWHWQKWHNREHLAPRWRQNKKDPAGHHFKCVYVWNIDLCVDYLFQRFEFGILTSSILGFQPKVTIFGREGGARVEPGWSAKLNAKLPAKASTNLLACLARWMRKTCSHIGILILASEKTGLKQKYLPEKNEQPTP